jgi:hypothetical protein
MAARKTFSALQMMGLAPAQGKNLLSDSSALEQTTNGKNDENPSANYGP